MIGHDIVPHIDADDVFSTSGIGFQQVAQEHLELGHIFEHFQHSLNEKTLKYVTGTVKHLDVKIKVFQNPVLKVDIENQEIWYANFEKQRFRDCPVIPYFSALPSHTIRGSPSC